MTTDSEIAVIVRGLSKSEKICVRHGKIWSGQQRNRLIDKGIADPACRGAKPVGGGGHYTCWYNLPLTEDGLRARAALEQENRHD